MCVVSGNNDIHEPDTAASLHPSNNFRIRWKHIVIVLAAVTCVYAQTLRFGFVNYDDDELVYRNGAFLSEWSNVGTAFATDAFVGAGGGSVYYRPLLMMSYIVDYHLWHLNAGGYHFTNLLLHALTSLEVYFLALLLVNAEMLALLAGLLFALHPVQTESVAWIAGRNDVLLGLLLVAMMICFTASLTLTQRGTAFRRLAGFFFVLALLTKESAAFYVLLLPLLEFITHPQRFRKSGLVRTLKNYWPFAFILAGYLLLRVGIFGTVIGAERLYGHRSMLERLENVPAIFVQQWEMMLAPFQLSVAHPLDGLVWSRTPWNVAALVIFAIILLSTYWMWKYDRVGWLGVMWILIGLVPLLGIIPVAIPVFEHRLYVPMAGFALLLAALGKKLRIRLTDNTMYAGIISIGIILAVVSFTRLPVWRNGVALFSDAVEKCPSYSPSYFSLAGAYYEAGAYVETENWIGRYLTLVPGDIRAYSLLRDAYFIGGQFEQAETTAQAMTRLEPQNPGRFLEAGMIAEHLGKFETAVSEYHSALRLDSNVTEAYVRLGKVSEALHQPGDAISSYRTALEKNPVDTVANAALANLYEASGRNSEAIELLEQCLHNGSNSREIVALLKNLYLRTGDLLKADQLSKRYP
ncbi:MAG TPA: tetratricopeptide repeat protein [Bacteroidota bacterium]|nr:tetratricopeptide repeat protein [Bacteroidota bacterium]